MKYAFAILVIACAVAAANADKCAECVDKTMKKSCPSMDNHYCDMKKEWEAANKECIANGHCKADCMGPVKAATKDEFHKCVKDNVKFIWVDAAADQNATVKELGTCYRKAVDNSNYKEKEEFCKYQEAVRKLEEACKKKENAHFNLCGNCKDIHICGNQGNDPMCPKTAQMCDAMCVCNKGFVLDLQNGHCTTEDKCTPPPPPHPPAPTPIPGAPATTPAPGGCMDTDPAGRCEQFKKNGFCEGWRATWMNVWCKKSCNACN